MPNKAYRAEPLKPVLSQTAFEDKSGPLPAHVLPFVQKLLPIQFWKQLIRYGFAILMAK